MDETIKLLRERAILCAHLSELFDGLIEVVKNNSPDVQEPIHKIETVIRDLGKNEQKSQDFFKQAKMPTFAKYVAAQKENIQREVAEKLLHKIAESQLRLRNQVAELQLLVQRGKDYVEFNMNILARISASDTYGAEAQTASRRSRRMFEANI